MSDKQGDSIITIPDEERTNDDLIIKEWFESVFREQPSTRVTQRNRRIHKVPQTLRMNKRNMKEFDPVMVSFGPYNHGKKDLQLAEQFKQTSLRIYASYCHGKSIEDLRKKVLEVIDVARDCYLEGSTNEYNDEEFAEMMLLDGCLVLNLIDQWQTTTDVNLIIDYLGILGYYNVYRDMFLLENQLPYRVLHVLMSIRFDKEDQRNKILDVLLENFDLILSYEWKSLQVEKLKPTITSQYENQPPLHLLEILRSYFLLKSGVYNSIRKPLILVDGKVDTKKFIRSFQSVTEIKAKGILFRPCISSSAKSEASINFKSYYLYGKLEIPPIVIDEHTKSTLLNLIAYEMCPNNPNDFKVTSYVRFMKMLIQHPDDVKELRTKNILHNIMGGDDEVVRMFKEIVAPPTNALVFGIVEEQIQRHYDSKARTWVAELVAKYFSSPWTAIAFLGAVALLVLAILQSYFTIHPPKK